MTSACGRGSARDAFVHDWYVPFKDVRSNQCYVLETLADCFAVARGHSASAQHALLNNAAEGARQAADDQLKKRSENDRGSSAKEVLGLVASITGFVATVSFEAPQVSAAFGAASAFTGLAASTIPDESSETKEIKGASAGQRGRGHPRRPTPHDPDELAHRPRRPRGHRDQQARHVHGAEAGRVPAVPAGTGHRAQPRDPNGFHHESSDQYSTDWSSKA